MVVAFAVVPLVVVVVVVDFPPLLGVADTTGPRLQHKIRDTTRKTRYSANNIRHAC